MTIILILMGVFLIGIYVALFSKEKSIWSPIGMSIAELSVAFMVHPMFQESNAHGWIAVVFGAYYFVITLRAWQLYFRSDKTEKDE